MKDYDRDGGDGPLLEKAPEGAHPLFCFSVDRREDKVELYFPGLKWPTRLGNARIDSSLTGNTVTADQAYSPYGEIYDTFGSSVAQNRVFAGLTGDFAPSTGTPVMWDAANRELSMVGRWLSPDPAQGSWNAYSYVTDPNRFLDPSGLDCVILHGDSAQDAMDSGISVEQGDCSGKDPNNEFYFDGTVNPNSVAVLPSTGDVAAQVNGRDVQCAGDCPTVSSTTSGQPGSIFQLLTTTVPTYYPNDVPLSRATEATLALAYERSVHDLNCVFGGSSAAGQAGAAAFKLGQPVPGSKSFVTPGSSLGTSPLSEAFHGSLRIGTSIPSPVGGPGTGVPLRLTNTASLGTAAARYAPFLGAAAMGYSVYNLNKCLSSTPSGH